MGRQGAQFKTNEVQKEHTEKFLHCEECPAVDQVAQRGCAVFVAGLFQDWTG